MNDGELVLLAVSIGALLLCACCVVVDRRQVRESAMWYQKQRTYDGIRGEADFEKPFELIGPRPESERPAGVDWSISTWSSVRGEYDRSDRGYKSATKPPSGRAAR